MADLARRPRLPDDSRPAPPLQVRPVSRENARRGYQAGLAAGAAAGLVMLVARLAAGVPTLPELTLDHSVRIVPPVLFSFVLDRLLFSAKPLFLGCIATTQLLLCGGLGAAYGWLAARLPDSRARRRLGLANAGALWIALGAGLLPLFGGGLFGSAMLAGPVRVSLTLLTAALVFGFGLAVLGEWVGPANEPERRAGRISRRALVRAVGTGSLGVVAGAYLIRAAAALATSSAAALGLPASTTELPPLITPNEKFYKVSKNVDDPAPEVSGWTLEISGLVEKPLSLDFERLSALPAVEQAVTLECVSNFPGGNLIGNAIWKGVRLSDLLALAGPQTGAVDVVFSAADGYTDSITIERALSPDNLIAWTMNGEPLPQEHGGPARLLAPGIYGMKNVKWLTGIQIVDYDFKGFWQEGGWSDTALVKTMSKIDLPRNGSTIPAGPTPVGGVAFGGDRGISRVEVSFDVGATWREASVLPALSRYSLSVWTIDWNAPVGDHGLVVRAYDGAGEAQSAEQVAGFPDGGTGYHSIAVKVRAPLPTA